MKQTCWALIVMLTLSGIASAQDRNNVPQLGVKGGVNISSFRFGETTPPGVVTSGIVRPTFGLFGNIPVARNLSVQVEGVYSGMGGLIKTGTTQGDFEQRFNYLALPLLLKYHVMKEFKILGGVEFGTLLAAKQINEGLNTNVPKFGTNVFFSATDATSGTELWKSDATAAGTVLVRDINPGTFGSSPQDLHILNGALFDADVIDEINLTTSPVAVGGTGPRLAAGADDLAHRFDLAQLAIDHRSFLFARWLRRRG